MSIKLTIGTYRYEHTEALFDGRVKIDGVDAALETEPLVSDLFRHMIEGRYDIAELGLTYFLRTLDVEDAPFMALPIFQRVTVRTWKTSVRLLELLEEADET